MVSGVKIKVIVCLLCCTSSVEQVIDHHPLYTINSRKYAAVSALEQSALQSVGAFYKLVIKSLAERISKNWTVAGLNNNNNNNCTL